MSSFGVLDEGFFLKTLDDILAELEEDDRAAFGSDINTQADSVLGQLNGIFGDELAQLWELGQAVFRSLHPDYASGDALDNVASITGALRLAAAPSTVTLKLNVSDATVIPAGSIVSAGANGSQWQTLEEATQSGYAPLEVAAESVETGPINGNVRSLNTIVTPISGWVAQAFVLSAGVEPFVLADLQTLTLTIDNGEEETVIFDEAEFSDITAATANEVANFLANYGITGLDAVDVGDGTVILQSTTDGAGSAIQITGGTAAPALGFASELREGFNYDEPATLETENSGSYVLANNQTLVVEIDDGSPQTITFLTADFDDITDAQAVEVARVIADQITGATAYVVGDSQSGTVRIESASAGGSSSVVVTSGTANAALGFPEDTEGVGVSGTADLGRDLETDPEFRLRREELLRLAGASTLESIRAAVRALDNVAQAFIFENTTDDTDANGLPPHSFEVIASGGDDTEIAEEIFDMKPVGIATYRDPGAAGRTVAVTDSQGFEHDINFTRPTEVDMYVAVTIEIDAETFGGGVEASGIDELTEAIVAFGDTLTVGDDVVMNAFVAAIMDITGVVDVTALTIEDTDPPVNTANIVLAIREIARFDAARVEVTVA